VLRRFINDDSVLLAIRLSCILTVHSLKIATLITQPPDLLAGVGGNTDSSGHTPGNLAKLNSTIHSILRETISAN